MNLDKGEYSFSTCWNIKRFERDGAGMIEEIRRLGFRRVELNYNVRREHLRTIEPMIERGDIAVSSVHNTFPYIGDSDYGTDSVLLGFQDEDKRRKAADLLLGSMEYAHRYGAEAVVVHPGEVPFDTNVDAALKSIYREQGKDSNAYRQLWQDMIDRRRREAPKYLATIRQSLEEVCEAAARKGWKVKIGIETRSRCNQMPTLAEAEQICAELAGAGVYLWYDIGHAAMMERMGLYDNAAELSQVQPYIYGVHIHETVGLADHWCPYIHSKDPVDFDRFLPAIRQAKVKVYELKAACTAEEIHDSHARILAKLSGAAQ